MIVVRIKENIKGQVVGYDIDGHSNVAPKGYDIVCAGISTLAQTAMYGLRDYLHHNVECDMDEGKFHVKLKSIPDLQTEALLRTMIIGLEEFANKAPQVVTIVRG